VLSLGYETLIFEDSYLEQNSWISSLPWLDAYEVLGRWHVYRAKPDAPIFRASTLRTLLMTSASSGGLMEVPSDSWITDRFALAQPVVVNDRERVRLAWMTSAERRVHPPQVGLLKHYFSASVPAYTVDTPNSAGLYRLVFLDDEGRIIAERRYHVVAGLAMGASNARAFRSLQGTMLPEAYVRGISSDVVIENHSAYYLQVHTQRPKTLGYAQQDPFSGEPAPRSFYVLARFGDPQAGGPREVHLLPPQDVPPYGSIELSLSETAIGTPPGPVRVEPRFVGAMSTEDATPAVIVRRREADGANPGQNRP
jgi:hypothetical protein